MPICEWCRVALARAKTFQCTYKFFADSKLRLLPPPLLHLDKVLLSALKSPYGEILREFQFALSLGCDSDQRHNACMITIFAQASQS